MKDAQTRLKTILYTHPEIELITTQTPTPTPQDAANFCNVSVDQIVKTLILKTNTQQFIAVILCGSDSLDQNALRKAYGCKKVRFAKKEEPLEQSGFPAGGVCPVGMKQDIKVFVDENILNYDVVIGGGGKPDSLLKISPQRIVHLNKATVGKFAS